MALNLYESGTLSH